MKKKRLILIIATAIVAVVFIVVGIKLLFKSNSIENTNSKKYKNLVHKVDKAIEEEYGKEYGKDINGNVHIDIRLSYIVNKNEKYKDTFINDDYKCDMDKSVISIYNTDGKITKKYNLDCKDS